MLTISGTYPCINYFLRIDYESPLLSEYFTLQQTITYHSLLTVAHEKHKQLVFYMQQECHYTNTRHSSMCNVSKYKVGVRGLDNMIKVRLSESFPRFAPNTPTLVTLDYFGYPV